jgi:hypothetical protein
LLFPNIPKVSAVYIEENTRAYLQSSGFGLPGDECNESFSKYDSSSMIYDDWLSGSGATDSIMFNVLGSFYVLADHDVDSRSYQASGTYSAIIGLHSAGWIDGSVYNFWATAGVNQQSSATIYLERTQEHASYEDNVRIYINNDILRAESYVYQGILCEVPSRVPLSSYRLVQRITVQAVDEFDIVYCTFRVQGGAIIGVDGSDEPRVTFSGWNAANYVEDLGSRNDCIDSETNELISTSRRSQSESDFEGEEIAMCNPSLNPNDQSADLTLVVPGEPASIRVQVVNQILPVLSLNPSSNFGIDPEAFFGGDLNGSGRTKPADFDYLLSKYGYTIDDLFNYEPECDLNGDGIIDDDDIELFETYFCLADYNGDGTVDVSDLLDFLDDYSNLDIEADMNEDSVVDILDYLDFSNYYSSGC